MRRRLRIAAPVLPLAVLLLILLLVEDPKKPWSGVAYVAAVLTIVGVGWSVGRWLMLAVPSLVFVVALFFSASEPDPDPTCDPACWSAAGGYALLAFVLGALLALGVGLRRSTAWVSSKRS